MTTAQRRHLAESERHLAAYYEALSIGDDRTADVHYARALAEANKARRARNEEE